MGFCALFSNNGLPYGKIYVRHRTKSCITVAKRLNFGNVYFYLTACNYLNVGLLKIGLYMGLGNAACTNNAYAKFFICHGIALNYKLAHITVGKHAGIENSLAAALEGLILNLNAGGALVTDIGKGGYVLAPINVTKAGKLGAHIL